MSVFQCTNNRASNGQRFLDGELFFPFQLVAQRLAVDERHDIIKKRVCFARVEERENVWVLKIRGCLDLLHEPLGAQRRSKFRPQHLYRHLPIVFHILGEIHGGHATFTELAFDSVAIRERGRQLRDYVRQ